MAKKYIFYIGWLSSLVTIAMYFSYVDQIILNLQGHKGSLMLPIITTINCLLWLCYAIFKPKKDWPIFACNFPGIIFGLITAITAF